MDVRFSDRALAEYRYWEKNDSRKVRRIDELIRDICRQPFRGIGKPEPLRYEYAGFWSRRIDQEHRLVYKIAGDTLYIAKCRFHY